MGNTQAKIHPTSAMKTTNNASPKAIKKQVKTLLDAYQEVIPGSAQKHRTSRQRRGSFFTTQPEDSVSPRFKTTEMIHALSDFEGEDMESETFSRTRFFADPS